MEPIDFFKMSGSGNDFIIIDNRNRVVDEADLSDFVTKVCRRKLSVGADGLILIEESDAVDFKWQFFNSDGSCAEMCGNGARCAARFAYLNQIAGPSMSFETAAGIVSAQVSDSLVKVQMPDPAELRMDYTLELKDGSVLISSVNTGVPHVVIGVDEIDGVDVVKLGREARLHSTFAPAGTNVNFVSFQKDGYIAIRTYERGVEDETLACGTGAIAAAIVTANKTRMKSPIKVLTRGGEHLTIYFQDKDGTYNDVYLEGDARIIYKGRLWEDAWQ
ncbi:MAG: diaminopimelate epimerase [Desulfobacterales bacterium]|uniref:Diaminopimelate epimerase n=1 Tax=Candidatus Desulfatibia vada TaxID=2841696 RepID=A0A8J6P287_9BACT|nr:diaminopimelate epimerase [Candidatus Desulfatibia vada]MBL6972015.1 diaminopimelate epimerase [Desulfobacterales bacterium]